MKHEELNNKLLALDNEIDEAMSKLLNGGSLSLLPPSPEGSFSYLNKVKWKQCNLPYIDQGHGRKYVFQIEQTREHDIYVTCVTDSTPTGIASPVHWGDLPLTTRLTILKKVEEHKQKLCEILS